MLSIVLVVPLSNESNGGEKVIVLVVGLCGQKHDFSHFPSNGLKLSLEAHVSRMKERTEFQGQVNFISSDELVIVYFHAVLRRVLKISSNFSLH